MNSLYDLLQSTLKTPVGNNQDSDPEDVKQSRRKLNILGIENGDENYGYIDHNLDRAIRTFQRGMNLKEDGLMNPGGETETALNDVLHFANSQTPIPKTKPTIETSPPIPTKKPSTPNDKKRKLEELNEKGKFAKKVIDFFRKKNPASLADELTRRSWHEYYNKNNDPI